jgi:hypothetical protein
MERATGRQVNFFESETQHLNHSICTPDGTKVISDNDNFDAPEDELIMVDVASGRSEVLWWPNRVSVPAVPCAGPSMSSTGKYVASTSNYTGEPQVYFVPLL